MAPETKPPKTRFDAPRGTSSFTAPPEDVFILREKDHPLYDEREGWPLDEMMVLLMMEVGSLEPVLVRRNDALEEYAIKGIGERTPVCIDGIQRIQHLIEANKRRRQKGLAAFQVEYIEHKADLADLFATKLAANYHRPETMLSKARKAHQLHTVFKWPLEKIQPFVQCKSKLGVQHLLKLMDCSKAVQDAVERGLIPGSAAAEWSALTVSEQKEKLEERLLSGEKTTVAQARRVARGKKAGTAPPSRKLFSRIVEAAPDLAYKVPKDHEILLRWAAGEITAAEACAEGKGKLDYLEDALEAASKDRRKEKAEATDKKAARRANGKEARA